VSFNRKDLELIQAEINRLDPEHAFVELDIDHNTVRYSADFILHESISSYTGDEEPVRAYIVCWLCTVGGYLPANIELEKRYSIGRPKVGAELDVLVKEADGTSYALIEVKARDEFESQADQAIEGQLYNIAPHEPGTRTLCYATINILPGTIEIRSITIDYHAHPAFKGWKLSRAASNAIPANYGVPLHVHLENGGVRDLRADVDVRALRKLRKRLHDVLWRGATPDNTIYAYVVKLFLAKIYDEQATNVGERYQFQIYYTGSRREDARETFARIDQRYRDAYERYLNVDGTTHAEPLNNREFSVEQVAFVVELVQDISFTKATGRNSDILGGFFEGITRDGFKQTKGLFFTHMNIVCFILAVLGLDRLAEQKIRSNAIYAERLPYIIDPSSGSGTFLLAAMAHITDSVRRNRRRLETNSDIRNFLNSHFPSGQENLWAKDFLYGIDQNDLLAMSTKVNMVLRRDGNTHVYKADGLAPLHSFQAHRLKGSPHPDPSVYSKDVANAFDAIISNPPFSITLDPQTIRQLHGSFELAGESNSENLFVERWYQLLRPGGRLGVVLPESFFSTRENLDARLFLFAHFNVKAVVSLPRHAFEPWTPTRTSLLFAQKKTVAEEQRWKSEIVLHETRAKEAFDESDQAASSSLEIIEELRSADTLTSINETITLAASVGLELQPFDFDAPLTALLAELARWKHAIDSIALDQLTAEQKGVVRSIKKTFQKLDRRFGKLRSNFSRFGAANTLFQFGLPLPTDEMEPKAIAAIAADYETALSRIDVRVWALRKTAEILNQTFYVLSIENIGYKRTKRGETERPNDLFFAYVFEEVNGRREKRRVLDIDLSPEGWLIEILPPGQASDAASLLASKVQWG